MKYRLLTPADTIEATDELLRDDCETWESCSTGAKWFIGAKYAPSFYVPMRRKI